MKQRHGFTIIELIVSISVIAVLLAIALPALLSAKRSAAEIAAMAHQREAGSLVRQHALERRDGFPFFGIPGTNTATLCLAPGDPYEQVAPSGGDGAMVCLDMKYWSQPRSFWAKHMRYLGYKTAFMALPPELASQNNGQPVALGAIDVITCGAYAPPKFWRSNDPQSVSDHNVQRWSSVSHPSRKIILQRHNYSCDPEGMDPSGPVLSWFADGHTESLKQVDMLPAVPLTLHFVVGQPGLTTLRGLDGLDR